MNWNDLRGHRDQIEMLRRSIARGRLAHAYLFAGPAGIGKARFARILAQCLFCDRHADEELQACGECSACRQMQAGSHPDFFAIGCPEGKREIPIGLICGSDEQRGREGLIHDLSLSPMAGSRRIAVIDDAILMNEASQNAFLKTLEEPPPDSLIILIIDNPDAALPTIRSRCQLLRFSVLSTEDIADLLIENQLTGDETEAAAVAAMSEGSLQTASQLLNPVLRDLRERLYAFLADSDMKPLDATKAMADGLDEIGSDTSEHRRGAGWLIRFTQEFYRQTVLLLCGDLSSNDAVPAGVRDFARRLQPRGAAGTELAMDLFDRCVLAENHIDWNISPARTIESLFDELARMVRSRS